MLYIRIKVIESAAPLVGHLWDGYCQIFRSDKDQSLAFIIQLNRVVCVNTLVGFARTTWS